MVVLFDRIGREVERKKRERRRRMRRKRIETGLKGFMAGFTLGSAMRLLRKKESK